MKHDHDDLRQQAVEAVANYLHHRIFDNLPIPDMIPFVKEQADSILNICDNAMDNLFKEAQRRGLVFKR